MGTGSDERCETPLGNAWERDVHPAGTAPVNASRLDTLGARPRGRGPVEIRLLGRFEVLDDAARVVALGGHRQRAVLAVLAVHTNAVVSRDRLVEEAWNGRPPRSAVA